MIAHHTALISELSSFLKTGHVRDQLYPVKSERIGVHRGSVAEWFMHRYLKSGDPEFRSHFDHLFDLFHVVPGLTPRLRLCIIPCQLGFLTCYVYVSYLRLFQWSAYKLALKVFFQYGKLWHLQ